MKILITGASGFIGKHLIESLSEDNSVFIHAVSRSKILNLKANVKNHIADLSQPGFEKSLNVNVDIVVHLAQSLQYRNFPEGVDDIFSINVLATQTLLEWSRKTGVKKFIFASTGNVYKEQDKLLTENDICEPLGYYGASKYAAEQLIRPYNEFFQNIILRFFGVYGPGQHNMTIPNIINKVVAGKEIVLANDEGLKFTPLYIVDCIRMVKNVILEKQSYNNVYNVSGNEIVHLGELVKLIASFTKKLAIVKTTDVRPMYLMGDGSVFYKHFNYMPSFNIKKGLENILKYESK